MAGSEHRKAVRAAQTLLSITNPRIAIDGVWGPRSQAAMESSSGEVGNLVRSVKSFSDTLKPAQKPTTSGVWISHAAAARIIDNVSVVTGVPKEWLFFMLEKEPAKRTSVNGKEYRVDSVAPSGLYFGLMQVGADAWSDASALYPELGSFARNKFVPELNVLAAAGFAKRNIGYARSIHRYTGGFDAEIVYAMHNQGHSFISSAKSGGMGRWASGQSADAQEVLASAAEKVRDQLNA